MNVFSALGRSQRAALLRALEGGARRAVLGPPHKVAGKSDMERAFYYSDRAYDALFKGGATGGLAVAGYRDLVNDEDLGPMDYAGHALAGAALPIAPLIYGTSAATLGIPTTLAWHRALEDAIGREMQKMKTRERNERARARRYER